jgi:putative NADH-flavin reductase
MIKLINLLNENINSTELYVVEEKAHTIKMNNKPVYFYDFYFFADKSKAQAKAKELKNLWKNKVGEATIKVYVPNNLFDWVNVSPHTAISNGVKKEFWNIRGGTKMKNPNTNSPISISVDVDNEVGMSAKKFFNK